MRSVKMQGAEGAAQKEEISAGEMVKAVLEALSDYQAREVVCLDVSKRTPLADYMIIASGRSRQHVGALRDRLLRRLKEARAGRVQVEGGAGSDWVLIDGGGVWINLFHPETREFYNLEKLWSPDAPGE